MEEKQALYEIVVGAVIVTTSTGHRVECLPYGDDLMRAGSALVLPDKPSPPTYPLGEPGEDGTVIRVPYTAQSIDGSDVPAEDTEAWGQYLLAMREYNIQLASVQAQANLMKSRVLIHRATRVLDLPPDLNAWAQERLDFYGIPAPSDEKELLFDYFTSEVSKTLDDVLALMSGIMRATGIQEEVLDRFEDNFRHSMGRAEGDETQEDPEGTPEGEQGQAARVVDESTVDAA